MYIFFLYRNILTLFDCSTESYGLQMNLVRSGSKKPKLKEYYKVHCIKKLFFLKKESNKSLGQVGRYFLWSYVVMYINKSKSYSTYRCIYGLEGNLTKKWKEILIKFIWVLNIEKESLPTSNIILWQSRGLFNNGS